MEADAKEVAIGEGDIFEGSLGQAHTGEVAIDKCAGGEDAVP